MRRKTVYDETFLSMKTNLQSLSRSRRTTKSLRLSFLMILNSNCFQHLMTLMTKRDECIFNAFIWDERETADSWDMHILNSIFRDSMFKLARQKKSFCYSFIQCIIDTLFLSLLSVVKFSKMKWWRLIYF